MLLPAKDLNQLFCKEKVRRSKNGTHTTLEVHALLSGGKRRKLLVLLEDIDQALFLEQEIEAHRGIRDRPVDGESPRLAG